MKRLTSIQETYLAAAQVFHFAFREHFVLWFAGRTGRHWRTEHVLPALVKKGELIALPYGKRTLYAVPDRVRMAPSGNQVAILPYHGLACTDILTRYVLADPTGEVLSENICRANRWGAVPEWGIRYPQGTALLLEFCTADNVERGKVASKVTKYRQCLPAIEASLQAKAVVVFVLDVAAHAVAQICRRLESRDPFFFVDYQTFQITTNILTTPIYLWGNGQAYPLKK
jgi:hypothetical protein